MPAHDHQQSDVDADADSDQGDGPGPRPSTDSVLHVGERRLWRIERDLADTKAATAETLELHVATNEILRGIQTFLGQMVDMERAREARVSIVRLAVEKVGTLLERLSAPEALVHVATIARWGGVTAVALCAIVYGVGLSGYGFTIGSVGGLSGSVVAPADPPAPSPGEPVPTP